MAENVEVDSQIPVEQQTLETLPQAISKMNEIFNSLASEDAIKIFLYARSGITNSTIAIKALGLTQKRFYTRLRLLLDTGILEKWEHGYRYTFLGNILYRMSMSFMNMLQQKDKMELADRLAKSNALSLREKGELLTVFSKTGIIDIPNILEEVKIISDSNEFVDEVLNLLRNVKESTYMLTNRFDSRIMEGTFALIDKGIRFFFLSSEEAGFSDSLQALKILFFQPKVITLLRRLVSTRDINVRLFPEDLLYSFVVTDSEYGIIELPHTFARDFYCAFKFKSTHLCRKLIETFNSLYEKGKEDPRVDLARKLTSVRK